MKQFSNRYIFLYSAGLVAVVAVVLSLVSISLKPRQERNQRVEQKQMILKTIGIACTAAEISVEDSQAMNGIQPPSFLSQLHHKVSPLRLD